MSTTREIQIEDRHGTVLHVVSDPDTGVLTAAIIGGNTTVEIDEADRRDLRDFLTGA